MAAGWLVGMMKESTFSLGRRDPISGVEALGEGVSKDPGGNDDPDLPFLVTPIPLTGSDICDWAAPYEGGNGNWSAVVRRGRSLGQ